MMRARFGGAASPGDDGSETIAPLSLDAVASSIAGGVKLLPLDLLLLVSTSPVIANTPGWNGASAPLLHAYAMHQRHHYLVVVHWSYTYPALPTHAIVIDGTRTTSQTMPPHPPPRR